MTGNTKRPPIRQIVAQCWMALPRLNVICVQFYTSYATRLARMIIAVKNCVSPFFVFPAPHGDMAFCSSAAFPVSCSFTSTRSGATRMRTESVLSISRGGYIARESARATLTLKDLFSLLTRVATSRQCRVAHLFDGLRRMVITKLLSSRNGGLTFPLLRFRGLGFSQHPFASAASLSANTHLSALSSSLFAMRINANGHNLIIGNKVVEHKVLKKSKK